MIHMKMFHQDFVDRSDKIEEVNNELTLALLRATQGQFHNCAQLRKKKYVSKVMYILMKIFKFSSFFTLHFN